MMEHGQRSGGQLVVECLRRQGVEQVFCVPGESYLPVLDALYDVPEIQLTTCRQEGGAAMMAEAQGKLTGRPGVCMVTRAPGATNASAGVHIAFQDSTPMVLFIGQVARDQMEREAFQEVDYRRFFGQMAKWVAQIDNAARIPEFIHRAFSVATSGRPGPVVLALPEDMLRDLSDAEPCAASRPSLAYAGGEDLQQLRSRLQSAERPLAIIGGGGWSAKACADFQAFAEHWQLPVAASFRCQDYFDNRHALYAGDVGIGLNPKLAQRVRDADLLLVVGARLGEMTTSGYTLLDPAQPQPSLVHVHPGAEEIGRVYQPSLGINASPAAFARQLAALSAEGAATRGDWAAQARADYLAWSEPQPNGEALDLGAVIGWLREALPEDAIVCNGAGNYSIWLHRFFRYRGWRTQLAPTSGSMGYGVPAAIGAKRLYPQRTVVSISGDGCFMMHGQELATAMLHQLPVIFIVVNNGIYGTIRMHQQRNYPDRVVATDLANPNFSELAKAYGAYAEIVSATDEFAPAFQRALGSGRPALLELRTAADRITPTLRLSEL